MTSKLYIADEAQNKRFSNLLLCKKTHNHLLYFILSFHFNKVNYFQLFASSLSEMTAIAPNYHKVQYNILINKLHWYQECLIMYCKKIKSSQIQHRSTFNRELIWKINSNNKKILTVFCACIDFFFSQLYMLHTCVH